MKHLAFIFWLFAAVVAHAHTCGLASNGNLTNDGVRSYGFDAENQLTNATLSGAIRTDFIYDGLNRRRIERDHLWNGSSWVKTNEIRFVYDGNLIVQERDTNNNVLVTYTRGLDLSGSIFGAGGIGGLLARSDASGSTFYHADGSGNVTALMDSYENMVGRYLYSPFGKVLGQWGNKASVNEMKFSSMPSYWFGGNGFWGRFWLQDPQRWANNDPIQEAGGVNMIRGMDNDPVNEVDPLGLDNFGGQEINLAYNNNVPTISLNRDPVYQYVYHPSVPVMYQAGDPFPPNVPPAYYEAVPTGEYKYSMTDQPDGLVVATGIATLIVAENAIIAAGTEGFGILGGAVLRTSCPLAAESGTIDTSLVRFSQNSISGTFKNGGTIEDLATSLNGSGGEELARQIPPIRLVQQDGLLYTLDNRRLAAFSMTDFQIPYRMARLRKIANESWKFTTTAEQGWGQFITVAPPRGWQP